jgi:O-antigen ligase
VLDIFRINWQYFILLLLSALIPYGTKVWPVIAIGIVFWIYNKEYKKINLRQQSLWFWVYITFFLLYIIGFFHSKNKIGALEIIQGNIGFLLFPLLLNNYSLNKQEFKILLMTFCFSNIIISSYLILRVLFNALFFGTAISTYSQYSIYMNPSYFSLFLIFSISMLFIGGFKLVKKPQSDLMIKLLLSTILIISVLFCCSKIGYISLALLIPFLVGYFILKTRSYKQTLLFLLISCCTCFLFIRSVPTPMQRFRNMKYDYINTKGMDYLDTKLLSAKATEIGINKKESTLARLFIWGSAWPVIKQNCLWGVGTGDVTNAMSASAKENGIGFLDSYSMHNQYIETQLGLGIFGLFVFLLLTIGVFIYSLLKRDLLFSIFSMLFIINSLVESILVSDYFSLFFSLFIYLFLKMNTADKTLYQSPPVVNLVPDVQLAEVTKST